MCIILSHFQELKIEPSKWFCVQTFKALHNAHTALQVSESKSFSEIGSLLRNKAHCSDGRSSVEESNMETVMQSAECAEGLVITGAITYVTKEATSITVGVHYKRYWVMERKLFADSFLFALNK